MASYFLSDILSVGDTIAVFIERNNDFRMPQPSHNVVNGFNRIPVLMIGPGTGIAPFRSFIQHQIALNISARYENHLYFGCRHQKKDYIYGALLQEWHRRGQLFRLRTAFSRDENSRTYVQHLLYEDREIIFNNIILAKGYIFVCGDAKNMAKDVHEVLIDIIVWGFSREREEAQENSQFLRDDAIRFLKDIADNNRYKRDIWT